MQGSVKQFVQGLSVIEAGTFENMTVLGINAASGSRVEYLTLEEALQQHLIEVTEKDEGGAVPELLVKNSSNHRVLMIQGEGLVGAKQNRTLNASILVDAGSHVVIPVSCVEQGRWSYKSRRFSRSDSSHSKLRAMMYHFTTGSLAREGSYRSDQGRAWREIDRKSQALSSRSRTHAMHDVYQDYSRSLDEYVHAFSKEQDWHGIAVAINGEVVGMDIFDKPETMRRHLPPLIRSYALDAIESRGQKGAQQATAAEVRQHLSNMAEADSQDFKSPGLGSDVRFKAAGWVGGALVYDDTVLHLAFFRLTET